jgi:sugar phosphate isomerase/epimerase
MPRLLVLQSLWTFEDLNGAPCPPNLEARLDLVRASGFDGAGTLWLECTEAQRVASLARERDLVLEGLALPSSIDALKPALEWGTAFGLHHLNVQPDIRTANVSEGVAILEGWQRLADEVDFPVHIETHRGRLTNDLLFTLELLDACPWLKLTADLSHYVVGGEIVLPVSNEADARITRILDNAAAYHGRVATSEQVQAEIGFAQHAPWVEQFSRWWARGFEMWRAKAPVMAELSFLCELGPRPYAVTGADNHDLSDRWADSLALQHLVRRLWAAAGRPA